MLSLAKIKERHDSRFLILGGVTLEYLRDELLVDGIELEGYRGIVVWGVSVLKSCQCLHVFSSTGYELLGEHHWPHGQCMQRSDIVVAV